MEPTYFAFIQVRTMAQLGGTWRDVLDPPSRAYPHCVLECCEHEDLVEWLRRERLRPTRVLLQRAARWRSGPPFDLQFHPN